MVADYRRAVALMLAEEDNEELRRLSGKVVLVGGEPHLFGHQNDGVIVTWNAKGTLDTTALQKRHD